MTQPPRSVFAKAASAMLLLALAAPPASSGELRKLKVNGKFNDKTERR
jgi:hypothetical protein